MTAAPTMPIAGSSQVQPHHRPAASATMAMFVLYAKEVLGLGAVGYGLLNNAMVVSEARIQAVIAFMSAKSMTSRRSFGW